MQEDLPLLAYVNFFAAMRGVVKELDDGGSVAAKFRDVLWEKFSERNAVASWASASLSNEKATEYKKQVDQMLDMYLLAIYGALADNVVFAEKKFKESIEC
jgi:hypothetical protein